LDLWFAHRNGHRDGDGCFEPSLGGGHSSSRNNYRAGLSSSGSDHGYGDRTRHRPNLQAVA